MNSRTTNHSDGEELDEEEMRNQQADLDFERE